MPIKKQETLTMQLMDGRKNRTVIFDMDGLMSDTEKIFVEAWGYAGCKPIMAPALWQPDEEMQQILYGKFGDLEMVKDFLQGNS